MSKNQIPTSSKYSLLRQHDSWSRIQISFQGFVTMIHQLNVFNPIWAFVQGFGLKFGPIDEYHIDYKSRFHASMSSKHPYSWHHLLSHMIFLLITDLDPSNLKCVTQYDISKRTTDPIPRQFGQRDIRLYITASTS
jgi:hypothetical protein